MKIKGFSLIEVLVAIVILVLSLLARLHYILTIKQDIRRQNYYMFAVQQAYFLQVVATRHINKSILQKWLALIKQQLPQGKVDIKQFGSDNKIIISWYDNKQHKFVQSKTAMWQ